MYTLLILIFIVVNHRNQVFSNTFNDNNIVYYCPTLSHCPEICPVPQIWEKTSGAILDVFLWWNYYNLCLVEFCMPTTYCDGILEMTLSSCLIHYFKYISLSVILSNFAPLSWKWGNTRLLGLNLRGDKMSHQDHCPVRPTLPGWGWCQLGISQGGNIGHTSWWKWGIDGHLFF